MAVRRATIMFQTTSAVSIIKFTNTYSPTSASLEARITSKQRFKVKTKGTPPSPIA